ncbi:MAG: DUF58 domain-containing protein [Epsilonproteobacteria bacterium]|nr:DUF58 domain-containing protein [Campylobacterota bacterium]
MTQDERFKALIIKARRRLFGERAGRHLSALKGEGLDLAEIREYRDGDDVRKINWRVTARTAQAHVNLFEERKALDVAAVFLVDGAVYFGSVRQKQEVMAEIMALLGFAAVAREDRFRPIFFERAPLRLFRPQTDYKGVYGAVEYALGLEVLGKRADPTALADYLIRALPRRCVVVVVGDMWDIPAFDALSARHELYIARVRDPFEMSPAFFEGVTLQDPASGGAFEVEMTQGALRAWRQEREAADRDFEAYCLARGIGHTLVWTDEDPFEKLRELLR